MAKKGITIFTALIIFTVVYNLFSTGYGIAPIIESSNQSIARHANDIDKHHLCVIYEREMQGEKDLLQLDIDSTFHQIGKGGYRGEQRCKREFRLRSYDKQYCDITPKVVNCFIDGNENRWVKMPSESNILGYECQRAMTNIADNHYHAWYTTALPYPDHRAKAIDPLQGLIMELRNHDGTYAIKVKHIIEHKG